MSSYSEPAVTSVATSIASKETLSELSQMLPSQSIENLEPVFSPRTDSARILASIKNANRLLTEDEDEG